MIHGFGILKQCAALANGELGQPPQEKVPPKAGSAQEVIDGAQGPRYLPVTRFNVDTASQRPAKLPSCDGRCAQRVSC